MKTARTRLLICLLVVMGVFLLGRVPARAETLSNLIRLAYLTVQAPTGVAVDGDETLFVVESTYNRVAVIANGGVRIGEIRGLQQPISVAVDAAGRLYVGEGGTGSISVFGPDRKLQGKLGAGNGEFGRPVGLAVNAGGDVYVVDSERDKVCIYGVDRQLKLRFGQSGSLAGQIRRPLSIALDRGTNEIVVVDLPMVLGQYGYYEGSRVQFFDASTGGYKRGFGQNGVGEGKLAKAMAVAADHEGRIYVSDAYQNIVEVFSRTGTFIETIYDSTARMRTPVGLTRGAISGRLFVSSVSGNRVDIYGKPEVHTVTSTSGTGGSITPVGTLEVKHGASLDFVLVPTPGYVIKSLYVDDADVGPVTGYRLPVVVADHALRAEFGLEEHAVRVEIEGNGTVAPSGPLSVPHHRDLTLAITPDEGWRIVEVLVDGNSVGSPENYTLTDVTTAHTLRVVFARLEYVITASAGAWGSISPSGTQTVFHGDVARFTFAPQKDYRIAGITVDGQALGPADSYTFTNVVANHGILVTFARQAHRIYASSSEGGRIEPAGMVDVEDGSSQGFDFVADLGYVLNTILVDNTPVPLATPLTFNKVTASHTIRAEFTVIGDYPVAVAGPDQTVATGDIITLSGIHSFDPDGDSLTFRWEQTEGILVDLIDANLATTSFIAPAVDEHGVTLEFRLTVTDATGLRSEDTCLIQLLRNNLPPLADAGPDRTVKGGDPVSLNGSASADPDGEIVSHQWIQIDGAPVTLSGADNAMASFIAPGSAADTAALAFRLVVVDNSGLMDDSECRVNIAAANQPPVASAGPDLLVREGENVTLSGSDSADADGALVSSLWTQQQGKPPVILHNHTTSNASFIAPEVERDGTPFTYQLAVTDEAGLVTTDTVTVLVYNAVPVRDLSPAILNKKSKGSWVTVNIELPGRLSPKMIDTETVAVTMINGRTLEPSIPRTGPLEISDANRNGTPELMVKFDRQALGSLSSSGASIITIRGRLTDGREFQQEFHLVIKDKE